MEQIPSWGADDNVPTFVEPQYEYSLVCPIHPAIKLFPELILQTKLTVKLLYPNNLHARAFLISLISSHLCY
jgi:hypothetical protein